MLSPIKYTRIIQSPAGDNNNNNPDDNDPYETIGRVRISVAGLSPTSARLHEQTILDTSDDDTIVGEQSPWIVRRHHVDPTPLINGGLHEDLCILGGVLMKMEQFSRQDTSRRLCRRIGMSFCLLVLVEIFFVPIFIVYLSNDCTEIYNNSTTDSNINNNGTAPPTSVDQYANTNIITDDNGKMYICEDWHRSPGQTAAFVISLVVLLLMFAVFALVMERTSLAINWLDIEAALDTTLNDVWEEVRPTGYSLSRTTDMASLFSWGSPTVSWHSAGSIHVDIRRPRLPVGLEEEEEARAPFRLNNGDTLEMVVGDSIPVATTSEQQGHLSLPAVDRQLAMAPDVKP